ncbi:MAG: DUF4190 domain-containing protein [Planctomycetaceae bacterium]
MSIITTTRLTCPHCRTELVSDGRGEDRAVLCSRCRTAFRPSGRPLRSRLSGKATASLMLGAASFVGLFLTGIPAIVLGLLALRDIRRGRGRTHGTTPATIGIVTGVLFGVLWGGCLTASMLVGYLFARSSTVTENPQEVETIAGKIGRFAVPEELEPVMGQEIALSGQRTVIYGSELQEPGGRDTVIVLMQSAEGMSGSRELMEQQARQHARSWAGRPQRPRTEIGVHRWTIRGKTVDVTESLYADAQSDREHLAILTGETGPLVIVVLTRNAAAETAEPPPMTLSEDQVRQFFESFQ